MRIDILAIGSRGDVQPYVALGRGLQAAGYSVRVVTLAGFEDLVLAGGLDHFSIGAAPKQIAGTAAGREWVEKRENPADFLRGFARVAGAVIQEGMASYWQVCRDVGALIVSPMGILVGGHVAERLQIPLMQAQFAPPVVPTRYSWDGRRNVKTAIEGGANALLHTAFHLLMWSKLRRNINQARSDVLSLPPLPFTEPIRSMYGARHGSTHRKRIPILGAYSPAVAPRLPDWGDWIHVTGYWFLDAPVGWTPPTQLVDFLRSGPPPVFVGFGSTPFPQPGAATQMVLGALGRSGQRGIVVTGGSGLANGRLSDTVLGIESVPHTWLFPQVCAAVHHGGAGVTGAALRAGLPSAVVPVFADQPFWGKRVHQLGAGPKPIPAKQLTTDNLADAIQATASREMRARAAAIGEKICREDGIGQAVETIGAYVAGRGLRMRTQQYAG